MKVFMVLVLLGLPGGAPVLHSIKYFYTSSSGVPNFPQFVVVSYVDDMETVHYDSNTRRAEPKQDWMKRITEEDPNYWERNTEGLLGHQQVFKGNIETLKQRFNQTGGVHMVQFMYGCDWDDETNDVNGFRQHGYDGEDFIALDLKTETWVAPVQQAVITKHKWENNKALMAYLKNYHTQECPEYLKKYMALGRSSLMRRELPSVSLLQKTPSSPVTCHATGFYPDRADLFWRRDDEELHEGVDKGEILPNHDGTFQMSVDLDVSSVPDEDWGRFHCVFQLDGVPEDVLTKLDKRSIRSNRPRDEGFPTGPVVGGVLGGLVAVIILVGLAVFFILRNKSNKKGFGRASMSDTSSSSGDSDLKTVSTCSQCRSKMSSEEQSMLRSSAGK